MADMGINGTILNTLKEYYTDNVAYAKIGNEFQFKSQKALDKVAVFLQFYLIFIKKYSGPLEEELRRNGSANRRK